MKILLLSPLPPPSGGIAHWTERYLKWSEKRHDVTVVNTALQGERAREAGKTINLVDEAKRSIYIIKKTKEKIKDKPDIIHINTSCSRFGILRDWICMKVVNTKEIPVILHCHCNISDQLANSKIATKLFVDMVRKAQKVLVLNSRSQEYVNCIDSRKSQLVPNFVLASQIADKHPIRTKIKKVVYVGDVSQLKGSDDFYKIAEQNPDKEFIAIGSLTRKMEQIKKPHNVITTGRLESIEITKYLDDADVFLFPSVTEGFSIALLEAMARGLPVIATNVGAALDMIENSGGVVVPVHDINAMQCALNRMANLEIREMMSNWNINKVKNNYEYCYVLENIFKIYEGNR